MAERSIDLSEVPPKKINKEGVKAPNSRSFKGSETAQSAEIEPIRKAKVPPIPLTNRIKK